MKLNAYTRPELDPFSAPFFVLCTALVAGGVHLEFGEQLPECMDLNHLHIHYSNGVVGTKAELDNLNAPVKLYQEDPIMPIAHFVAYPDSDEDAEELNPESTDSNENVFSLENASLLTTKDDLIGYAAEFGMVLTKASNISLKKMLATLEDLAKDLDLIK